MLEQLRSVPLKTPLLVFLFSAALGVWASYDLNSAMAKFTQLALAVVVYFILVTWPEKYLGFAVSALSALTAGIALYFLWTCDWLHYSADFAFINQIGTAWMAVRPPAPGFFPQIHPNIAGGLVAAFLPLSLYGVMAASNKARGSRLALELSCAGLSIIGLVMTSSRAAWFSLAVGLALWLWWASSERLSTKLKINQALLFTAPLILFVVAIVLLVWAALSNFLTQGNIISAQSSAVTRVEIAWNSLHLARDYYFLGGGLAAFPGLYSRYMRVIQVFEFGYAHNLYLDLLIEQGILGLGAILWIVIASIEMAGKALLRRSNLAAPILAGMIVFLLHGVLDDAFYGMGGTSLLFVLPGFAATIAVREGRSQPSRNGTSVWFPWLIAAEVLVLLSLPVNRSGLYANLGAIQMSKQQLAGWPNQGIMQPVSGVEASHPLRDIFDRALFLDANNATALYRLGFLEMGENDFLPANAHLQAALVNSPGHRGVRKLLGYNYAWLGQPDLAYALLSTIPEATEELNYYIWWWGSQDRADLVRSAEVVLERIEMP